MSRTCKHCSIDISHLHYNATFCSKSCKTAAGLIKDVAESHIKYPAGTEDDRVECPICGLRTYRASSGHMKTHHGLTKEQVKERFPGFSFLSIAERSSLAERLSGANNPGYQHGGKFSPFSKKFVAYAGLSDDEKDAAAKAKSAEANASMEFYNTQVEFYLAKGMTQEEAERALRDRQVTFNLDICIEKHGEVEGRRIWQERQDKWQSTLNSKSEEEKNDIDRRKATKVNYRSLWGGELDSRGWIYLIRFDGDKLKFGVTTKDSIHKRYDSFKDDLILFEEATSINHAFAIEQLMKHRNKDHIKRDSYGEYGWTEVLNGADAEKVHAELRALLDRQDAALELFESAKDKGSDKDAAWLIPPDQI